MTEEKKKNKQAFDAQRTNAFLFNPNDLVIIGLDTEDGPEHALYDERVKNELDPLFVGEIRALGILQTVKVRKNGDKAEVVAGRQRVRAAREVNKNATDPILVPCMVDRGSDDRMRDITISENEHRVNDSIEVKLKKLERYLASGRSKTEAAQRFKVSPSTITTWLSLLEAGPEVRAAVETKQISPTAASQIARLPRAAQGPVLAQATANGAPTSAQTKVAVETSQGRKALTPPSKRLLKRIADKQPTGLIEAMCKWMLGEFSADVVPGLNEVLVELGEKLPTKVENIPDLRTEKEKEPGFGGPECFGGDESWMSS